MTTSTLNLWEAHATSGGSDSSWSLPTRIVFRFGMAFATLLILPFPMDVLPGTRWLAGQYGRLWAAVMPWFGQQIVGVTDPDRLQLIACTLLAFVTTLCWSLVDREDRPHTFLARAVHALLRFWLASAMLAYGVPKVVAGGTVEHVLGGGACIAAAFLFWRKTSAIGALFAAALLASMILRAGGLEIRSVELALAAAAIVLGDVPRVIAGLRGTATKPAKLPLPWLAAKLTVKAYVIGWIVFFHVHDQLRAWL